MIEFWKYWLDVRAWGLGRPLLFSLPTVHLTWEAISIGTGGLNILALVLLWIAMVQEWVKWEKLTWRCSGLAAERRVSRRLSRF